MKKTGAKKSHATVPLRFGKLAGNTRTAGVVITI